MSQVSDPLAESLRFNIHQLAGRVRQIEKMLDTRDSSWWRRLWWRIDGWPRWTKVATRRSWRPWH